MSLGVHSVGNGGKLSVDSGSEKSASGAEQLKSDDSSKFSKAIDDQVSTYHANADTDEHIAQIVSEQLQLPDHSKGAQPVADGSSMPQEYDSPDFIEAFLEPGAPADIGVKQDADDVFTGEIQGFNVPLASFGQRVTGTFSVVETHDPEESGSTVQAEVNEAAQPDEGDEGLAGAASDAVDAEQADSVEIAEEPPKPAGVFGGGDDVIAQFMRRDTGEGEDDTSHYFAGGFID